jgi:two-component system, sensor histidine kinase and response regulator
MPAMEKILIVDDSADDAELMVRALRRAGHEIEFERVDTAEAMLAALARQSWDIIVADYSMPHFSGVAALELLKRQDLDLPFILVSGTVGEDIAVAAMKAGAQDYIVKHSLARLPLAVERELREAQIRRERRNVEARYRNLFESVPVGVFSIRPDGEIIEANPAFVQMMGFDRVEDLKRVNLRTLWTSSAEFARRNELLAREGIIQNFESQRRRPDGTVIWCSESLRAVSNASGEVTCFEGVAVNITERKRAQQELMKARDAALETARLKSEFLANMSHEIRTPLNGIIGVCELLRVTDMSADQTEFAELIAHSADNLLAIVNDILDFSKLSAGKMAFEQIDFELVPVVESVVNLLGERAAQKNLELVLDLDADLPAFVIGDPNRLGQVLTNLIGNALKFTDHGEVVVAMKLVRTNSREAAIQFKIADTGIGISAESQRALFQPFFQADGSTTRKYGGTGLGLAISRHLVEGMGGKLEVESELGKGSCFSFTSILGRSEMAIRENFIEEDLSGLRVLIVDDNDASRRILEREVERWGIEVSSASCGEDALRILRERADYNPFEVAILDLAMPAMDGLTLARRVRSDPHIAATRLLMMSSIGGRGDIDANVAPVDGWLTKPVKRSLLHKALAGFKAIEGETTARYTPASSKDPRRDQRSRVRLLLVEDNAINKMVAKHQLLKLGYEVDVAASGTEALDAMATRKYPLILMDCMMPEMDGYETTAEIRRREAATAEHIIIVAMTANALEGDREKCLAAGMDDYLSKPAKLEDMAEVLDNWLIDGEGVAVDQHPHP